MAFTLMMLSGNHPPNFSKCVCFEGLARRLLRSQVVCIKFLANLHRDRPGPAYAGQRSSALRAYIIHGYTCLSEKAMVTHSSVLA